MNNKPLYTVIGLMSGTSLDGVDAALIRTDGEDKVERLGFISIPYEDGIREAIRRCLGKKEDVDGYIARTAMELTRAHAGAVDWLLSRMDRHPPDIDLIGFHGQTIFHDPANKFTWQIGNGSTLAQRTHIDVVCDFRTADVAAGGQGAPLLPLYHRALAASAKLENPVAILNIGGVSNVTYIDGATIIAFDTGPGNALLDDWVKKKLDRGYDENGLIARQGKVHWDILDKWLAHPYFAKKPPKSLDRDAWNTDAIRNLSAPDGAATLAAFTVQAAAKALDHLPEKPKRWLVTGGGRLNPVMMDGLKAALGVPVDTVDSVGWDGDAMEAEGFAYLAVRSVKCLPLSLPTTTGVPQPLTGGRLYKYKAQAAALSGRD
jgi:anhydro-N-acetylmuramic acid kinase